MDTPAYKAFALGLMQGFAEAGGVVLLSSDGC